MTTAPVVVEGTGIDSLTGAGVVASMVDSAVALVVAPVVVASVAVAPVVVAPVVVAPVAVASVVASVMVSGAASVVVSGVASVVEGVGLAALLSAGEAVAMPVSPELTEADSGVADNTRLGGSPLVGRAGTKVLVFNRALRGGWLATELAAAVATVAAAAFKAKFTAFSLDVVSATGAASAAPAPPADARTNTCSVRKKYSSSK
jgi:hypothetical protein